MKRSSGTLALGSVPSGSRHRLHQHYGSRIDEWLRSVPALFSTAARRRGLTLDRYHDAGWASVLAVAFDGEYRQVMLKAFYDQARLAHETAALALWDRLHAPALLSVEPDLGISIVEVVPPGPGGASQPAGEEQAVLRALGRVHDLGSIVPVPHLFEEYAERVIPRMRERERQVRDAVPRRWREQALELAASVPGRRPDDRVLHADLYRENVLFDEAGRVVFIDPLPRLGSPSYDLAFFTMYYDVFKGFGWRLALVSQAGENRLAQVLPWAFLLGVDGLLYYHWMGDLQRSERMKAAVEVLVGLPFSLEW